jgi:DNA-binding MarR family transcriptional regulator
LSGSQDLGIVLGRAFEAFVAQLHDDLADRGFGDVKSSYGYVFRALDDGPRSVVELAQVLRITSQGVTRLLNEMEAAGYVDREVDAADRRVTRVRLAPRGREALATARRFHRTYERDLERREGPERARILREVLEALIAAPAPPPREGRRLRPF